MFPGIAVVVGAAVLLAACGDRKSGAKDDLGDAGFAMTAGDFFRAAESGDKAIVTRFLDGGFDIGTRDEAGDSVLHAVAARGPEEMLAFLLDRGMAIDLPGAGGRTPLAAAVVAGQAGKVRFLLRNGADPGIRDGDGFKPLMRAVEADRVGVVSELAPHVRQDLDTALLMASLLGKPEMIDTLTNYGASVYARTDDGRTGLMVAAGEGHLGAARMLVGIGANRFALDNEGRTAAEIAEAGGHLELAAELRDAPAATAFGLEEPAWPATELAALARSPEPAAGESPGTSAAGDAPPVPADGGGGADASAGAANQGQGPAAAGGAGALAGQGAGASARPTGGGAGVAPVSIEGATVSRQAGGGAVAKPAIVMRRYREPALPMLVESAAPGKARLRLLGGTPGESEVGEGAMVPGSRLKVVRVERRIDHSKLHDGEPRDVSLVEVEDTENGRRRQLVAGVAATAHDPLALVEDQASGRRYTVEAGDRFRSDGGDEYSVIDVRPNQVVLEHLGSGETVTLPLQGPRG